MNKEEFDEVKQKFGKETKRKQIAKLLNYASIAFASIGLLVSMNYFFDNFKTSDREENLNSTEVENLNKQIQILKSEIYNLKINIDTAKATQKIPNELAKASVEFISLKKEVENLNNLIIESPEKAISIPLLKIEIENQKEQNEKELKSIKDDISRVYDMNKWIIGLVFTMLVSIIVLNVSNLFSKNKKE